MKADKKDYVREMEKSGGFGFLAGFMPSCHLAEDDQQMVFK